MHIRVGELGHLLARCASHTRPFFRGMLAKQKSSVRHGRTELSVAGRPVKQLRMTVSPVKK